MAPGVCLTKAATPSLPLPPIPVGHCTASFAPTLADHAAFLAVRYEVKRKLVPEPSERCTTVIGRLGRATPAFSAAIFGSLHLLIVPRKMSPSSAPVSFTSPALTPGRFRSGTTPPTT